MSAAQDHAGSSRRSALGRRRLRLGVRCCALALSFAWVAWPIAWAPAATLPTAASPYVAIMATVAARAWIAATLWGLPILIVVLLRRRWFCRYLCPTGLLLDGVGRLRRSWPKTASRVPFVGQWIVLATLAGAGLGYPVLLWLDPLALFTGSVGAWFRPLGTAAVVSGAGLPLLLLAGWLWPGAWCLHICPAGATQDLLARPGRWMRRRGASAGRYRGGWRLARRALLGSGVGAAWAALAIRGARGAIGPLRPPGAAAEKLFVGQCLRCGSCARVCPANIIEPDLGNRGLAGWLAPMLRFRDRYCKEDCCRCTEVCPSGAIHRLSLPQKQRARIGLARVDMNICLLGDQHECGLCKNACPYGAISIVFSETDYLSTPRVDLGRCPGCGACEAICPTKPRKAIIVVAKQS